MLLYTEGGSKYVNRNIVKNVTQIEISDRVNAQGMACVINQKWRVGEHMYVNCGTPGRVMVHGSEIPKIQRYYQKYQTNLKCKIHSIDQLEKNGNCGIVTNTEQGIACLAQSLCYTPQCAKYVRYLLVFELEQGMACPNLSLEGVTKHMASIKCYKLNKYG